MPLPQNIDTLADALYRHAFSHEPIEGRRYAESYAWSMVMDPDRLVDMLVEAGVLEQSWPIGNPHYSGAVYEVVRPHRHEWRVVSVGTKDPTATVQCATCNDVTQVQNQLPMELPDA